MPRAFPFRSPMPATLAVATLALPLVALAPHVACAQARPPVAPAPIPPAGVRAVTLGEALAMARENAPAVEQARAQVGANVATVRAARGAYIPGFSLTASTVEQSPATARINPQTGELVAGRWATNGGFTANVLLFDGGARPATLRQARLTEEASRVGVDAETANVGLQVKQQFFFVLAAREQLVAASAQRAQALAQLELSRARVRAQTATRADSLQAFVALAQAEQAIAQAEADRQSAEAGLTRLTASPVPLTADPAGLPAEPDGRPALALDSAALAALLPQAPTIRQAQASFGAAEAGRRVARSAYLPQLSLSYGRQVLGSSQSFDLYPDPFRYSGSLRFNVSLPVFDQFGREETVARARASAVQAEEQLREARLAARQTLAQQLAQLRLANAQIATQNAARAAAEENVRVQQQRYQLGVATILDVLTAQNQLNQAQFALVQARFAARTAKAQLEALVGRDL